MEISSIECIQNGHKFYICTIASDVLAKLAYIKRGEGNESKIDGFQRKLNPVRATLIAEYLLETTNSIPLPLIVSAQPNFNLKYNHVNKTLTYEFNEDSLLVLDGQHRLFGYTILYNKYEKVFNVPIVIYTGLNTSSEVALFIDINTTQKGVSSSLLLDIKNLTKNESKTDELKRFYFEELNKDSVLKDLLSSTESKLGKISRSTFYKSLGEIINLPLHSTFSRDEFLHLLRNYFTSFNELYQATGIPKVKLNSSTYFKVSCMMFFDVINKTLDQYGNLSIESISKAIEPLESVPFNDFIGSNNSTLVSLYSEMISALKGLNEKLVSSKIILM